MNQTKKKCARKGRGCAKMEKMDIFDNRKGRGGGVELFLILQTDGIDSSRRKPCLIGNIPRRTWLIIVCTQKKGCAKSFGTRVRLQTDDGRKMKDLGQLSSWYHLPVSIPGTTTLGR